VFAVSSDKACQPASLMGASKRVMEQVLFWHADHGGSLLGSGDGGVLRRATSSRFANVAFSNGSLLDGFLFRIRKHQPLAGPSDVRRYLITAEEAAELCLLTTTLGKSKQIFVPRLDPSRDVKGFGEIAEIILEACGYRPRWYDSEEAARNGLTNDTAEGYYPCCFSPSSTSGEKPLEEFVADDERLVASMFQTIDVIGETPVPDTDSLAYVLARLAEEVGAPDPDTGKRAIVELLSTVLPVFHHIETGRNLDEKM
jgi:FlaA1/EpsC-like NDP-sugar epimerase